MPAQNYTRGQEGFDIYSPGVISTTNYPWIVSDSTKAGVIAANAGAFTGGNALRFSGGTATASTGFDRDIERSTAQVFNAGAGTPVANRSLWGIGFWFNATRMVNANSPLLALGTSANSAQAYQIFGYQQVGGAAALTFPSNITNLTSSPFTYPIVSNAWYWVDILFAINAVNANTWSASYIVDGNVIQNGVALTWGTQVIGQNNLMNRLKFYVSSNVDWLMDDLVLRTVSGADAEYQGSTPPVVADINALPARRIYTYDAVSNGDTDQWSTSDAGATANYLAATDPTGAKYVVANAAGLVDLYKFQKPAGSSPTGITSLCYRGSSTKAGLIQPVKKVGSTTSNLTVASGPNRFLGISENDGTNPWTDTSITAAQFGQQST